MLGIILSAIGIGLQAIGLFKQDQATKAEGRAKAEAAELEAGQVAEVGAKKEKALETEGARFIGQQIASSSGSGVRLDTGTSAQLIEESEVSVEADVNELRETYAKERERLIKGAGYYRSQYSQQRTADLISGTGSILGQGATLADRWNKWVA